MKKFSHFCRLAGWLASALIAVGCGKAGTSEIADSIDITTDAYWVAYKDGQKGQWLVLANGYTIPDKREVRSYSFRLESEDHKFAVILVCPQSSDGISSPYGIDAYFTHSDDISSISRICTPDKIPEPAVVTGIVVDNDAHIYPKLGRQRSIFAGIWGEQIEDFRAFSAWAPQLKRFDVIAALANITSNGSLEIDRFFIQRDISVSATSSTITIDFGSPRNSFAPDKTEPKPNLIAALGEGAVIQANETFLTGVDFVSEHGQSFRLASTTYEPAAETNLQPLPFVGFPNRQLSRESPATQTSDEGHRAFAQVRDNNLSVQGIQPIVRSAISMFKTPRDAIAVVPNADRATMSFTRDPDWRNVTYSWRSEKDPTYGPARMWYLTLQEHAVGNDRLVRMAVNAIVTRAWLDNGNPDAIDNLAIMPYKELAELRGWHSVWQVTPDLPVLVSARTVFMARSATQAVTDAILHSNTTDNVSYGDIRAFEELPGRPPQPN